MKVKTAEKLQTKMCIQRFFSDATHGYALTKTSTVIFGMSSDRYSAFPVTLSTVNSHYAKRK